MRRWIIIGQEMNGIANGMNITPESSQDLLMKHDMPVPLLSRTIMNLPPDMLKSNSSSSEQSQKRRSSSRSIKRKKFDDELVESSLVKTSRARAPSGTLPIMAPSVSLTPTTSTSINMPSTSVASTSASTIPTETLTLIPPEKRKSRPPTKRVKRSKSSLAHLSKDIGRWKPSDDLSLILSVQQTNDLETVFRGVEFSCKFSLQEIKERWYALMYTAAISKPAFSAMKQLHSDVIAQIQAKVLFSEKEEKLIASVNSSEGSLEVFQQMLEKNAHAFIPARTAKVLLAHWTLMKKYNLLSDQIAAPGDSILSFSDVELLMKDSKLKAPKDEEIEEEMASTDRTVKREIRQLESELPKWQVLVDSMTGTNNEEFNAHTLAVLKGRIVRYLMQSREISLGRCSKDGIVDVDLSLEGPASKISRRQGVIKLENTDFFLLNEGKRPFYVDGRPVMMGTKMKLGNNSIVEILGLRFVFLVNHEFMVALRNKS